MEKIESKTKKDVYILEDIEYLNLKAIQELTRAINKVAERL